MNYQIEEGDEVFIKAKIENIRETESGEINYDVSLTDAKVIYGSDNLYFLEGDKVYTEQDFQKRSTNYDSWKNAKFNGEVD